MVSLQDKLIWSPLSSPRSTTKLSRLTLPGLVIPLVIVNLCGLAYLSVRSSSSCSRAGDVFGHYVFDAKRPSPSIADIPQTDAKPSSEQSPHADLAALSKEERERQEHKQKEQNLQEQKIQQQEKTMLELRGEVERLEKQLEKERREQEQKQRLQESQQKQQQHQPQPELEPERQRQEQPASPVDVGNHFPELPACAKSGKKMAKSWLMVFMGHSGSTAIVSELQQHNAVHFELPEPIDHDEYERNGTLAYEYTRAFFKRGIEQGKTPGFKIRPRHILNPEMQQKWRDLVKEFDTHIIWQYRENLFKQSVGEYTYRFLNDTSVVEGLKDKISVAERCKRGAGCRFRIDNFQFFHEILRDSFASDRLISRAVDSITGGKDSCTLAVPYESYLYNRKMVMSRIFKFLGIAHEMHAPTRAKATKDNMCDAVENFGDVCREFYGCHQLRHMMDDFRNGCFCARYRSGPGRAERCDMQK